MRGHTMIPVTCTIIASTSANITSNLFCCVYERPKKSVFPEQKKSQIGKIVFVYSKEWTILLHLLNTDGTRQTEFVSIMPLNASSSGIMRNAKIAKPIVCNISHIHSLNEEPYFYTFHTLACTIWILTKPSSNHMHLRILRKKQILAARISVPISGTANAMHRIHSQAIRNSLERTAYISLSDSNGIESTRIIEFMICWVQINHWTQLLTSQ